jgi:hypothetical protein
MDGLIKLLRSVELFAGLNDEQDRDRCCVSFGI